MRDVLVRAEAGFTNLEEKKQGIKLILGGKESVFSLFDHSHSVGR